VTGAAVPRRSLEKQFRELKVNETLELNDLLFVGGTPYIVPESFPVLDTLFGILNENPDLRICLEGHVCCVDGAGEGYNVPGRQLNLSVARALAVRDELVRRGIADERLCARGFGHSRPKVSPELTPADEARNRRVEVRILSSSGKR